MGSGQRFRLPNALKRTKSSSRQQDWQSEREEYKIQHLLGITETDLNTARNQSISSSVTAKLPTLSFSDATTELGSSIPPTEAQGTTTDLHLKASSVLLHEEFLLKADAASLSHSRRLKAQGSSSTLNFFYDAQKTPLAISQQTSDSSRRDFALRKGAAAVVKSMALDKDSLRQLKLFRLSRSGEKSGTKKLTKPGPQLAHSTGKILFGNHWPLMSSDQAATSESLQPGYQSKPDKGVCFNPDRSATSSSPEKFKSSLALGSRQEAPQVKVNIRRPKAGAKYWFDGLEGDSSDESVHEPELQPSFVAGIEMAFEGGRIGPIMKDDTRITPRRPDTSSRTASSRTTSSFMLSPSAIPPRVSTLNAKSSISTISHKDSQLASSKPKASSLASTDLHYTSILDLSSSDDDDPPANCRKSVNVSLAPLRDSIAVESFIEIGTAKAISTKQNTSVQATPSLKRVRNAQPRRDVRSSMKPSANRRDPRSTYHSDLSSIPTQEGDDLLTSFPPTPTMDQASLQRPYLQDAPISDTASIESRRLMSVTRQEESLLAAIRSKKAALGQSYRTTADPRIQALTNMDRKTLKRHQEAPRSSVAIDVHSAPQARTLERVQSPFSDTNFDQASCTTFQTGPSNEPSIRYSIASFRTGNLIDPDTEISSSRATFSSALLPPSNAPLNRMSRSTFFSTSTNSSRDNSRSRKESQYQATLDKLQASPKRDGDVSSQDFIDWPYNGWMKVAAAH